MVSLRYIPSSIASFALLLGIGTVASKAQILSVYGTFSPVHISNAVTGSTTGLNATTTYGSYTAYGIGGGATYSPVHLGPIRLGVDLRASTARQSQGADTVLGGIRAAAKLPVIPFKPYVEAAGGFLGVRTTLTSPGAGIPAGTVTRTDFWAYDVLGGVDYALLPFLDLRLIEIGGGQGTPRSGDNQSVQNLSFLTINSGLVVHF